MMPARPSLEGKLLNCAAWEGDIHGHVAMQGQQELTTTSMMCGGTCDMCSTKWLSLSHTHTHILISLCNSYFLPA